MAPAQSSPFCLWIRKTPTLRTESEGNPKPSVFHPKTDNLSQLKTENLGRNRGIRRHLCSQASFQFLAHLGDFHPRHHDELAAQHLVRFVLIRQLVRHLAILAILVPAEAPIRNR